MDAKAFLLVLDGEGKSISEKLLKAGVNDFQVKFPMLPGRSVSNPTVWWFDAGQLLDAALSDNASSNKPLFFYWGPSRFVEDALSEIARRDGSDAILWSKWRYRENSEFRGFVGALAAFLPGGIGYPLDLRTALGNRFFTRCLREKLERAGIPCRLVGEEWPTPREELGRRKGNAQVTLALIAKDEERFLAGCLEQALPFVDNIVLVDTGSQDRTREIAQAYGAKVITHEWRDDFSQARNAYLDEVKEGWVLTLDADEFLTPDSGNLVRSLSEKGDQKAYLLRTLNYATEENSAFTSQANLRLFWRDGVTEYAGRIHEQLLTKMEKVFVRGPYVLHYGYLPCVVAEKRKQARYSLLLKSIAKDDEPFQWFNLGWHLLAHGEPQEALDAFEKYFGLEKEELLKQRPSAYWFAARAALEVGKVDLALEYADRACTAPLPEAHFTKGRVLEAMGRSSEAIECYRRAASLPQGGEGSYEFFNQSDMTIGLWRARFAAGLLLERERKFREAEEEYKKALAGDVSNLVVLLGISRVSRLQQKLDEALRWAKRAVEIHPESYDSNREYVETLVALGELDSAWHHLESARLSRDIAAPIYLFLGTSAGSFGDYDLAIRALDQVIGSGTAAENGTKPEDVEKALLSKSRCFKELGRFDEAVELLKSIPSSPEALNDLGCLYLAQRRFNEAETSFRKALSENPDSLETSTNLAQVLILEGKVQEALDIVYPLTKEQPQSLRLALLAARCLNSLKRYDEALESLGGVGLTSASLEEEFELELVTGNSYFGLKDWMRASDYYAAAYELKPNDPELLNRIGLLMLEVHRYEDAENAFFNLTRIEPENESARAMYDLARRIRKMAGIGAN